MKERQHKLQTQGSVITSQQGQLQALQEELQGVSLQLTEATAKNNQYRWGLV